MTGGAIDRGVNGAAPDGLMGLRTGLDEVLRGIWARFSTPLRLAGTSGRVGRRASRLGFFTGFVGRAAIFFALDAFLRVGAVRLIFSCLTVGRATFLAAADDLLLFEGFFVFTVAVFRDGRALTFCFFDAERFDNLLEDLRRTAVTRLLIVDGFQRERLGRDLRACRRL